MGANKFWFWFKRESSEAQLKNSLNADSVLLLMKQKQINVLQVMKELFWSVTYSDFTSKIYNNYFNWILTNDFLDVRLETDLRLLDIRWLPLSGSRCRYKNLENGRFFLFCKVVRIVKKSVGWLVYMNHRLDFEN